MSICGVRASHPFREDGCRNNVSLVLGFTLLNNGSALPQTFPALVMRLGVKSDQAGECLLMADPVENSRPWFPRQKSTRLRLKIFTLSRGFRNEISRSCAQKRHFQQSIRGQSGRTDFFNTIGRFFPLSPPSDMGHLCRSRLIAHRVDQTTALNLRTTES